MGLFGLGAVGERRQASRSSPPPRCDFDVRQSPFAKHCTLLQNVCLDQVRRGGGAGGWGQLALQGRRR